jgi:hypothetical protein
MKYIILSLVISLLPLQVSAFSLNPFTWFKQETVVKDKIVIQEVIQEKIVEVPVEKVVTKEIIKEVPVIKEVIKEVYKDNSSELTMLKNKILMLEEHIKSLRLLLDSYERGQYNPLVGSVPFMQNTETLIQENIINQKCERAKSLYNSALMNDENIKKNLKEAHGLNWESFYNDKINSYINAPETNDAYMMYIPRAEEEVTKNC